MAIARGAVNQRRKDRLQNSANMASISSSLRWPGTTATGIGKVAGRLGQLGDQRAGALLAGAGSQHQDADILVLVDQLEDLLGGSPSRITRSGVMPAMLLARAATLSSAAFACFLRFRLHDVGNAEPLLIAVLRSRSRAASRSATRCAGARRLPQ